MHRRSEQAPLLQARPQLNASANTRASTLVRCAVVASIALFLFAQTLYLVPSVQLGLLNIFVSWWGEGHYEMARSTFLLIFCVVPLYICTLVLEWLRDHNLERLAAMHMLRIAMFLRRKPFIGGDISVFSYGEWLFMAVFLGGNIVLFVCGWVFERIFLPLPGNPYDFDLVLQLFGIVLGYSCVYNMAFLLLPATRHCVWMEALGISYANGMKYHRWLGVLSLATGIGHALPFYWWWARQGTLLANSMPCFDCKMDYLSRGYPVWFNVFGEISLLFMILVAATSLPWIRRRMYETFYYTHQLFVLCVVFAVLHWVTIIWWLLPTLVVYLISRSISSANALAPVSVLSCVRISDDVVKIVITRSTQRGGQFSIGQFVYFNVPSVSRLQWHAFTIASSPRTSATTLTILIKALGDWTDDLMKHLAHCEQQQTQPMVYMDGFYGSSLDVYDAYSTIVLIGGGIGATPLFAILEDLVARLSSADEASITKQRVICIFSFRELSLLEEIHPLLLQLRALDPHCEYFTWRMWLTRVPSEELLDQVHPCYHALRTSSISSKSEPSIAKPFAEPLRSRGYRVVLYGVMFFLTTGLIMWLEFGGGRIMKDGTDTKWWPLQNAVEITSVFVLCVGIAYLFIIMEKWAKRCEAPDHAVEPFKLQFTVQEHPTTTAAVTCSSEIHCYRPLILEHDVAVGQRPNMVHEMQFVDTAHRSFAHEAKFRSNVIGVFISGPEALKRATEEAIAELGTHRFDIHDEEFEL